jgi:4-amino-4-deoxy-L-arabinose transferase-like glycosyltransferase
LRALSLGGRPWLALAAVLLLALGTSLAWSAATLMPDIFFPTAVLALFLLAFRLDALATWERLGLMAVIAVAIASHMAALGLCIALVALLWIATRFMSLPRPRLRYPVAAAAAGVVLALLSNFAIAHSFRFTPGGASFLFGRLVEDGIVARYLAERCPDPALRICAYAGGLPDKADDWLWSPDTPFYKLGGAEGFGPEAQRILLDSIARYPFVHFKAAAAATLGQLVSFATEISSKDNHPTIGTFVNYVPQLVAPLNAAHQQQGPIDTYPLNLVHVPVAALGIVGVAAVFAFRRHFALTPEAAALCLTVLLALAVNAAICGVFSHPVDRYQSRLVPLAPLALGLVLVARRRGPQP